MKTGTVLIVGLALVGGCWNQEIVTEEKGAALTLDSQTPENVAGTFRRGKILLRVESVADPLRGRVVVTRADRSELISLKHDGTDVAISVLGRLTATQNAAQPGAEGMVQKGDTQGFAALARTPEFALLPGLSDALDRAGLTAADYPAAKSIHDLAAHAGRMVKKLSSVETQGQALRNKHCIRYICGDGETFNEDTCSCEPPDNPADRGEAAPGCNASSYKDLRSDPCHDGCRGMCGPGCGGAPISNDCWKFVCGDCGYHAGCAFHDDMCGVCYDTYGVAVAACAICLTPIAVFVAKAGC